MTTRDHEAGTERGSGWKHGHLIDETRRGRREAFGEMLDVLREKGPEGLAETVRRVCGVDR